MVFRAYRLVDETAGRKTAYTDHQRRPHPGRKDRRDLESPTRHRHDAGRHALCERFAGRVAACDRFARTTNIALAKAEKSAILRTRGSSVNARIELKFDLDVYYF